MQEYSTMYVGTLKGSLGVSITINRLMFFEEKCKTLPRDIQRKNALPKSKMGKGVNQQFTLEVEVPTEVYEKHSISIIKK